MSVGWSTGCLTRHCSGTSPGGNTAKCRRIRYDVNDIVTQILDISGWLGQSPGYTNATLRNHYIDVLLNPILGIRKYDCWSSAKTSCYHGRHSHNKYHLSVIPSSWSQFSNPARLILAGLVNKPKNRFLSCSRNRFEFRVIVVEIVLFDWLKQSTRLFYMQAILRIIKNDTRTK